MFNTANAVSSYILTKYGEILKGILKYLNNDDVYFFNH